MKTYMAIILLLYSISFKAISQKTTKTFHFLYGYELNGGYQDYYTSLKNYSFNTKVGFQMLNIAKQCPIYPMFNVSFDTHSNKISCGYGIAFFFGQTYKPEAIYSLLELYFPFKRLYDKDLVNYQKLGNAAIAYNIDRNSSCQVALSIRDYPNGRFFLSIGYKRYFSYQKQRNKPLKIKEKEQIRCPTIPSK